MRNILLSIVLTLGAITTGCGSERSSAPPSSGGADHAEHDQGDREGGAQLVGLGLGGGEGHLEVALGPGFVTARVLDAHLAPIAADEVSLNLATGQGPVHVKGTLVNPDKSEWRLESTALGGDVLGGRYLVRIGARVFVPEFSLPEGSVSVAVTQGPRGGILVAIRTGEVVSGYAEIRFHAEFGEMEAWLGTDASMSSPLDVPVATQLVMRSTAASGGETRLAVRDQERNEDEEGNVNVRDGATNYFVYPTDYSEEPARPVGASGDTPVFIEFEAGGKKYRTSEFRLAR